MGGAISGALARLGPIMIAFVAFEKVVSFLKKSVAEYNQTLSQETEGKKNVSEVQKAFAELQYTVGSKVMGVIQGFFSMFGKGIAASIRYIKNFIIDATGGFKLVGVAIGFMVDVAIVYAKKIPDIFTVAFDTIPLIAHNAFEKTKANFSEFGENWKAGMNELF